MRRLGRAAVLVGLAVVVVAGAGVHYLGPVLPRPSVQRPPPSSTLARLTRQSPISMEWRSTSTGWVVLPNVSASLVFGTTDGGRHWRQQLVAFGSFAVHFFDDRHGVLLPDRSRPVFVGPPVPACSEAGQIVPSPCPPSQGPVRFAPQQPSAGGPLDVYRTDDGGDHWRRVPLAQPAPSFGDFVSFADPSHGWLLSVTGGGPFRQEVALSRTSDGGGHWTELLRVGPAQAAGHGILEDGVKGPIWFADARNGWLANSASDGSASVEVTHDGGVSWQSASLPAPPGGWRADVAARVDLVAVARAGGVLAVTMLPATVPPHAWVYVTDDGGDTWHDPSSAPVPGFRNVAAAPPEFLDGRTGWLEQDNEVVVTTDAGRSWQYHLGPNAVRIEGFDAITGTTAVVAGQLEINRDPDPGPARLYVTTDGGRSWRPLGRLPG